MARRTVRRIARSIALELALTLLAVALLYVALQTGAMAAFASWFGEMVADNFARTR